jgi:hypothetical protein
MNRTEENHMPGRRAGHMTGVRLLALTMIPVQWVIGHKQDHPERGDVPGWVMITLMSAILVAGILALAAPALEGLFNQAIAKVGK